MHTGNPDLDRQYENDINSIPVEVQNFLMKLRDNVMDNEVFEIEHSYEVGWNQHTERYFHEGLWPEPDVVAQLLDSQDEEGEIFIVLYKELYFRHVYAKSQVTQQQRFDSYYNYCSLFNFILSSEKPIDLDLPNQWLYDIIDEFIYQFQSFAQYKCKLLKKSDEEIQALRDNSKVWNICSVLNVLYSLVNKSNINLQLKAFNEGKQPEDICEIAGDFGKRGLYKMLGYFSIIGLLRLNSLLGDYHQALEEIQHIKIIRGTNIYSRVPECQMTTYYYVGFAYMMMHRYGDAINTFSSILTFIQRSKNTTLQRSIQYKQDMLNKQTEQMLTLLAICHFFYPIRLDETLLQVMKESVSPEKLSRLNSGCRQTLEEMFMFGCPKFLSPIPPDFDASIKTNTHKEPTQHQCRVFLEDADQQLNLSTIRSLLKLYSTMPVEKLANFLEEQGKERCLSQLMCLKTKMMNARSASVDEDDETNTLETDFYIDDQMIIIANTKVERAYADYFIKQINKFDEINRGIAKIEL